MDETENNGTEKPKTPALNWGTGIAIGVAIGASLGVATGNVALGLAIGIAIGAALAVTYGVSAAKNNRDDDPTDSE